MEKASAPASSICVNWWHAESTSCCVQHVSWYFHHADLSERRLRRISRFKSERRGRRGTWALEHCRQPPTFKQRSNNLVDSMWSLHSKPSRTTPVCPKWHQFFVRIFVGHFSWTPCMIRYGWISDYLFQNPGLEVRLKSAKQSHGSLLGISGSCRFQRMWSNM